MKLDAAQKRRITKDWHARLPEFGFYRPMWLLKRCGPLLVGLCLERTSSGDEYLPISHVHNLLVPSAHVSLTLPQRLLSPRTGAPDHIPVRSHASRFAEAVDRLVKHSTVPLTGDVQLAKVLAVYDREQRSPRESANYFSDMVSLATWAGWKRTAADMLRRASDAARRWPDGMLIWAGDEQVDVQSWLEWMHGLTHREALDATLVEELARHRLQKIPVCDLLLTEPYRAL